MGAGHDEDSAAQAGRTPATRPPMALSAPAVPVRRVAVADHRGGRRPGPGAPVVPRRHRRDVWWQEGLPAEGGRITVMHRGPDGKQSARCCPRPGTPAPGCTSTAGCRTCRCRAGLRPGRRRGIVFANFADQRLYLAGRCRGRSARPITPDPAAAGAASGEPCGLRFADFTLAPDGTEVWCVQELHNDGKVTRSIVAVPLDGSAAGNHDEIRHLASGSDFFAFPTPSPDGSRLAWISWNHPHMPWDGTELRVAAVSSGIVGPGRVVKGGLRESVLAPVWRDNTSLYVATDWTGWWNIYQVGPDR